MALHLVRHAKAGSRSAWTGDDRERPLSSSGRRQAEALADRLAPLHPPRLLSSPYLRCRQTLEPLAARCGIEIEEVVWLGEGAPFEPVLDALACLPDSSVLCSHGDVIPEVIEALLRRGAELAGEPNWKKASSWAIARDGSGISRVAPEGPPG